MNNYDFVENSYLNHLRTENEEMTSCLNSMKEIADTSELCYIQQTLISIIKDFTGVSDIKLFCIIEGKYYFCDNSGKRKEAVSIEDINIKEVLLSRSMLEFTGKGQHQEFTRIYPLISGDNLIGAIKIVNIPESKRNILHYIEIFLHYFSDILQREIAEEIKLLNLTGHFERNFNRVSLIIDTTKAGIWEWVVGADSFQTDERFAQIIGYTSDEISLMTVKDFSEKIHHDDLKSLKTLIDRHLKGKSEPFELELRIKNKNEKYQWVYCRGKIIKYDTNGNPTLLTGAINDINERKTHDVELKANEEKYRLIAENMHDVIWVYNLPQNRFIYMSPSIYYLRGLTVEEALAEKLEDIMTTESLRKVQEVIRKEIPKFLEHKQESVVVAMDIQQYRKDRSTVWIEISAKAGLNSSNEIEVIGTSRNIEERKNMERELQSTIRTKDKFFSIISHDLRNPFNSIIGFSSLLMESIKKKDYGSLEEYAGYIFNASHRAMDLLKNLLEWSRSQTGTIEYNPEYIDISETVNDAVRLLQDSANRKSISLVNNISAPVNIVADKNMLSTVLRNLISNAIKFTYPNGKIEVSMKLDKNNFIISVKDNGMGMDENIIPEILSLESNYTSLGTNKEKGTGLGLILCKEFVEIHGGKIHVESQKGKGSTFSFSIPKIPVTTF